jgi:hypothetical protein
VDDVTEDVVKQTVRHWRHPRTVGRAWRVALVVGTVLNAINHYDLMFGAVISSSVIIQTVLTYLVPYIVSTHGQVSSQFDNLQGSVRNEKN